MLINSTNPLELILILSILSLLPFATVMVSSFTKIIVVLSVLRNALGLQATPPNMVLNGLSIIISFFIMYPVLQETIAKLEVHDFSNVTVNTLSTMWTDIRRPLVKFLTNNSKREFRDFFINIAKRTWPPPYRDEINPDHIMILIPSFLISELSVAFQIGFIIYLPFVIIDLVVSNILMALGIIMISPTTISLPFKLLLFFLVDGWRLLIEGLIKTYNPI